MATIVDIIRLDRLSRKLQRWPLLNMKQLKESESLYLQHLAGWREMKLDDDNCKDIIRCVQCVFDRYPKCMAVAGKFFNETNCRYIDVYFYGIDDSKAIEIMQCYAALGEVNMWANTSDSVTLSVSVLHLFDMHIMVKFHKVMHKNISTIVGNMSIPSLQVCYDGKDYLFTHIGAICNMFHINIVDTDRYNDMYDRQLAIGAFATILPCLKKPTDTVVILRQLSYAVKTQAITFEGVYNNNTDYVLMGATFDELLNRPYLKSRESIASITFKPFIDVRSNMTAVEWYGEENYEDVGLDIPYEQFDIIEQSNLSDNIKQAMKIRQQDVFILISSHLLFDP